MTPMNNQSNHSWNNKKSQSNTTSSILSDTITEEKASIQTIKPNRKTNQATLFKQND